MHTQPVAIPIAQLKASRTNPRKHFDDGAMAELGESIRRHGVLQPIVARPIEANGNGEKQYEIVCGHRRAAAAKAIGLPDIPAMVRDLSDVEALEVQVIENLQRADLHPLEEAEGYRQLHEKYGYTVDDLAAKVGKSKAYVYARLKLCALAPAVRKPFLEGKIEASVALLIARIPHAELQAQAAKEILAGGWMETEADIETDPQSGRVALPYRQAAAHIERKYMLRLADAPFDVKDETLVPKAGPCATCPKRTGNQRELFGDVKNADVCTDPKCFGEKRDAAWQRRKAEAQASGQKVLEGKRAEQALSYNSSMVKLDGELHQIMPSDYSQKTVRSAIGKAIVPKQIVLARDESGKLHELVEKADVPALKKAAGLKEAKRETQGSAGDTYQDEQKRKAKLAKARGRAMVDAVLAKAAGASLEKIWPLVKAFVYLESLHQADADVLKAKGIERQAFEDSEQAFERWIASHPAAERETVERALIVELIATGGMPSTWSTELAGPTLVAAGKIFGVDLKAVSAAASRKASQKPKATAKAKSKKPKKAAAKKKGGRK